MTAKTIQGTAELTGASLLGGESVWGTGREIRGIDPHTGAALAPGYPAVGRDEVERAAALAWQAFRSYRQTTPEQRSRFLETVADNIEGL
jgi:2,5-dioxopentanoate dehydrogenase